LRDFKICAYGEQVVSILRDWHESLKAEQALAETTILNEVAKCKSEVVECKSKMEVEVANFELKLERQKNKFRLMEMKYQFALACSWDIVVVLLLYPSFNIEGLPQG